MASAAVALQEFGVALGAAAFAFAGALDGNVPNRSDSADGVEPGRVSLAELARPSAGQ